MTAQQFLLSTWNWHPLAIITATVILAIYVGAWRATRNVQHTSKFQTAKMGLLPLALGTFLLTLVSPLDALADGYLFSAHMLQHLLLLLVVPPLLLMAWPMRHQNELKQTRLPALGIFSSWLAGVGAMWFWHVPTLCNAATSNQTVRGVQVVSLLLLGTLFWRPILAPQPGLRLQPLGGVLYLFTACVGCTLLGIIITFAPVSVCPVYMHPMDHLGLLPLIRDRWGMTPAVDEQVGGLMMWVPACLIYICSILGLLARWHAGAEPEVQPPAVAAAPKQAEPGMQPDSAAKPGLEPSTLDNPLAQNIKPKPSHA